METNSFANKTLIGVLSSALTFSLDFGHQFVRVLQGFADGNHLRDRPLPSQGESMENRRNDKKAGERSGDLQLDVMNFWAGGCGWHTIIEQVRLT